MNNSSFLNAEMYLRNPDYLVTNITNHPVKINMNLAVNWLSIFATIQAMLSLGCSIDFESLSNHIRKPLNVTIAALCQFVFMPLIVFGLVKLTNLLQIPMIVLLVTTSVPGGLLSTILCYFAKGDVALSLVMTTFSSVLAFIFLPFNLFLFGTHWLPGNHNHHVISFQSVITFLVLMLIPAGVGILIKWRFSQAASKTILICRVLLIATILAMATLTSIIYELTLLFYMPRNMWIISPFLPLVGFSLGYLLSTLAHQTGCTRRTVALETMCQNGQLSFAVLKVTFPDERIGSFFAFPLLYSLFELIEGMIIVAILRLRLQSEDEEKSELRSDFGRWGGNPVGTMRRVSLYVIDSVKRSMSRSSKQDGRDHSGNVSDASETKTDDVFLASEYPYDETNEEINEQEESDKIFPLATDKTANFKTTTNTEEFELNEIKQIEETTPITSNRR